MSKKNKNKKGKLNLRKVSGGIVNLGGDGIFKDDFDMTKAVPVDANLVRDYNDNDDDRFYQLKKLLNQY